MSFAPGVYRNVPMCDYLAAPGINKHLLDALEESPLEYYEVANGIKRIAQTHAMEFGGVSHAAILENRADWVVQPISYETDDGEVKPWSNNAGGCRRWRAEQTLPILTKSEADMVLSMMRLVHSDPLAAPLLKQGEAELSMFCHDAQTGLRLKSRPDWVGSDYFVELKTTIDASTEAFSREIFKRRYHVQAGMNIRIARQLGLPQTRWIFIAVEKGERPRINVRELRPEAILRGEEMVWRGLTLLAECQKNSNWYGYSGNSGKIEKIDLPAYAYSEMESLELTIGGKAVAL